MAAIPATLWQSVKRNELFHPSLREPGRFEVNAVTRDDARSRAEEFGYSSLADQYANLMVTLSEESVEHELRGQHEIWERLLSKWASSTIRHISLSSVGLALAHSNWVRVTKSNTSLDIWVSEGV